MGSEVPKQYLTIGTRTVLAHTLDVLAGHNGIAGVVVAIAADDTRWVTSDAALKDKLRVVVGGVERCHSVLAGIEAFADVASDDDWILVHDAARPCLRSIDIDRMVDELRTSAVGGILAVPVRDTLKRCNSSAEIVQTVDRTNLWHALTPQMFRMGKMRDALLQTLERGLLVTDEAQAIEAAGFIPRIVEGHADNIKITHPADLTLAEIFLRNQRRA
jgi:2-C-methyl-D-erythritol 4-phosphate cytidylyltransferase